MSSWSPTDKSDPKSKMATSLGVWRAIALLSTCGCIVLAVILIVVLVDVKPGVDSHGGSADKVVSANGHGGGDSGQGGGEGHSGQSNEDEDDIFPCPPPGQFQYQVYN